MSVTEIKQANGDWSFTLRPNTPRAVLDAIDYFGHIAIVPGRVNVPEYGDQLLTAARYVGVLRGKDAGDSFVIRGAGMAFWLGNEDGQGDVFETAVEFTSDTFADVINGLLPPSGSVTAGTIHSVAGTYSGTHRYVTPRKAITYVTDTYGAEWRVNGNGTLDAGTAAQLYVTTPRAILVRKQDSQDLALVAMPGRTSLGLDVEDYTTRVVLLAEGEGDAITTGTADAPATPYNDLHGNDVVMTRVVSESETTGVNADTRAALVLSQFEQVRPNVSLSTDAYDVKGDVQVGDSVYVYDPDAGFEDVANAVQWEGEVIHPVILRVFEMTWPMRSGWTFAYRDNIGVWTDLSDYVKYEGGQTSIVVGELPRSLSGLSTEPIGTRPNPGDSTIPNSPVFGDFSVGAYQSAETSTTKAAIRAQWSIPLNLDGSTIVDGDHYEIRYRVSEVIGYQIRWGVLEAYRWGSLSGNRWGAPISEAVEASPEWQTAFIPWGTNAWTILELTPGVVYEMQIRAVDAQVPPHQGPFSASSFVTAIGDLFAPSEPAAPSVAGNLTSIQVTHTLGKNSGGTYNLEPDLDHLEVHVGGSDAFYADDNSMVGKIVANAANLGAEIPVVQSFTIQQADQVHVKVRAVDRSGNKSGASPSATVTALLIDNAHISDLSVSKLTAGTITAQTILAAAMEVGTGGNIQLTEGSLRVRNGNGHQIMEIGKRTLDPAGGYGLTVFDEDGQVRIRMGQSAASENGYGLEAADASGKLVAMSQLAFGPRQVSVQTRESTNSTTYANLATEGPIVGPVVIGPSGRAMVIVSAYIEASVPRGFVINTAAGFMSFAVNGPTLLNSQDGRSASLFFNYDRTITQDTSFLVQCGISRLTMLTGLTPGEYFFVAQYRCGTSANAAFFSDRNLTVLPY